MQEVDGSIPSGSTNKINKLPFIARNPSIARRCSYDAGAMASLEKLETLNRGQ
jgi:hypothetical protein